MRYVIFFICLLVINLFQTATAYDQFNTSSDPKLNYIRSQSFQRSPEYTSAFTRQQVLLRQTSILNSKIRSEFNVYNDTSEELYDKFIDKTAEEALKIEENEDKLVTLSKYLSSRSGEEKLKSMSKTQTTQINFIVNMLQNVKENFDNFLYESKYITKTIQNDSALTVLMEAEYKEQLEMQKEISVRLKNLSSINRLLSK